MSAWDRLATEGARLKDIHLRTLFEDPERFEKLCLAFGDLTVDLSREKLDQAALAALLDLARETDVESQRARLFAGEPINNTENRAVLHVALRGGAADPTGGEIEATLSRFLAYAEEVRTGTITDVINIGIGGSDLGPAMAVPALKPDCDGPRLHFVSNVDGAHFADTVKNIDPATTLVIIASKTFTTLETMANAALAKDWLGGKGEMAALSTNVEACAAFGIPASRVFGFWDWVGGRYSMWGAIGLPLAIAIGAEKFRAFLAGAKAMDDHFREAPLAENLPVLLALTGIWRRNVMGWPTVAVIPYDQRLARLPAYLQQLDMESNGKRVTRDGAPAPRPTGPVIWGEPGTNAQHSFFQLIHQGTDAIPVDFVAAATPRDADTGHHALLLANMLAQAQALAFGRTEAEAAAENPDLATHRTFPGDRPSTTILFRHLDPFALGRLIALYEHKIFVQGAIWGVNSYDQWGVELGKVLAKTLTPVLQDGLATDGLDSATAGLVNRLRELGPF